MCIAIKNPVVLLRLWIDRYRPVVDIGVLWDDSAGFADLFVREMRRE